MNRVLVAAFLLPRPEARAAHLRNELFFAFRHYLPPRNVRNVSRCSVAAFDMFGEVSVLARSMRFKSYLALVGLLDFAEDSCSTTSVVL